MQQTRAVEMGTGAFVLLGFAALFFLTTRATNIETLLGDDGYEVTARFQNVGSLKVRAPVSMAGVKIGQVKEIAFDPERLDAVVTIEIGSRYDEIPEDSDASILTAGLLGSQYIGLQAGGSEIYLEDGSELMFTQSAIVLENLIGRFLVNMGSGDDE